MNLLNGSSNYFKIPCYKKNFPLRFRIDLFAGSYEIYVSKSLRKPGIHSYDYLYSVADFEVNYEDPSNIKSIYFSVTATERLVLNFICNFKSEIENHRDSLPAIQQRVLQRKEKLKHKKKQYEFFSKDMTLEDHIKLQQLAGIRSKFCYDSLFRKYQRRKETKEHEIWRKW